MASNDTRKTASSTTTETPFTHDAHAPHGAFDPTGFWTQGQQAWTRLVNDSVARWQAFADQYAAIEQQIAPHAQTAVTSWAQLAKDAIAYGQQLSAEARKLSLEAARKLGVSA